jgi:hypothetical protein
MMTQFKKSKIAAAVLAASVAAPASAATWSAGDWEVSYTGTINLFANMINNSVAGGQDSFHMNEGLLPAFHTMKAVSPATNGLTGTAQISFAPDSSRAKFDDQAKNGNQIDMREVFFAVDGSFGTVSIGTTLSLFQRQAILNDMTLFGVGAFAGTEGGGTTLGRIAFGYTYPEFNSRMTWKSPDMGGFGIEVGIFDPDEQATASGNAAVAGFETDLPQFQVEATYSTSFDGGSVMVWAGGLHQEMERVAGGDVTSVGYNLGTKVSAGGLSVVASFFDGEAIGTVRTLDSIGGNAFTCAGVACTEADNDGYYVQAMYNFNGSTNLGASYGESNQDADAAGNFAESNELTTIGVYHDVNSWLKLVAEYNMQSGFQKNDHLSLGGFIFW